MRLFYDVSSEHAALFKRLMKIHLNPPILYSGFNSRMHVNLCAISLKIGQLFIC